MEVQAGARGGVPRQAGFPGVGSAEFYARLLKGGRLTVPVEVVEMAELERGELMKVRIQVDERNV